MTENRHQGKFHLLVVFAIPLLFLLVSLQNWYVLGAFLLLLAVVTWLLFRRKT